MRQIGSLAKQAEAERFAAYLVTEGIAAHAENDGDQWALWVREENQLDQARQALVDFRADPNHLRYQHVQREAAALREETLRQREAAKRNVVEMRNQWGRGGVATAKRAPLTFVLIGLSVLASLWANSLNPEGTLNSRTQEMNLLGFVSVTSLPNAQTPDLASRFTDIRRGQLWRLITPIFVHMGAWHLVMNMYWVYRFGSQIEHYFGTAFFGLLVLAIALISNVAQACLESPFFFGMSGVAFGLFGFVWIKTMYDSRARVHVSHVTSVFFLVYAFLCLFDFLPIANTAHFAGLGVGAVVAYVPLVLPQARDD